MSAASLTLHYAPRTRAFTALRLLEELGADKRLESFDLSGGANLSDEFRALSPMSIVPVVVHGDATTSEVGAIAIYPADRFHDDELAPAADDPRRAAYLRWCFFASAVMEPCSGEKFFKWELPASSVALGSFERMMKTLKEAPQKVLNRSATSSPTRTSWSAQTGASATCSARFQTTAQMPRASNG